MALLGILTDETSLYKKGSFGDAEIEDPATCVAREVQRCISSQHPAFTVHPALTVHAAHQMFGSSSHYQMSTLSS